MKYMSIWSIKEENYLAALERFGQEQEIPDSVTLLGRWHEMGTGKGFTLVETDDPVAFARIVNSWTDLVDQRVFPVLDDEEVVKALQ